MLIQSTKTHHEEPKTMFEKCNDFISPTEFAVTKIKSLKLDSQSIVISLTLWGSSGNPHRVGLSSIFPVPPVFWYLELDSGLSITPLGRANTNTDHTFPLDKVIKVRSAFVNIRWALSLCLIFWDELWEYSLILLMWDVCCPGAKKYTSGALSLARSVPFSIVSFRG